jgi:Flp pilus assembly protein TadG
MKSTLRSSLKRLSDNDGVAAVEFAVILMVFLMIVMGILEFGYDWYLRNALANASREGCRWGVMYRVDAASKMMNPCDLPPGSTIEDVVSNYLRPMLPAGTSWTTSVTGPGYTAEFDASGTIANQLTVTVTTVKTWSALGNLIPGLNLNNMTITVATTMRRE